jgi:hypothetical protein
MSIIIIIEGSNCKQGPTLTTDRRINQFNIDVFIQVVAIAQFNNPCICILHGQSHSSSIGRWKLFNLNWLVSKIHIMCIWSHGRKRNTSSRLAIIISVVLLSLLLKLLYFIKRLSKMTTSVFHSIHSTRK